MEDREVIYAAYGSNLLKERFLVYIEGGNFMGGQYNGCNDKTEPVDLGWMWVPHRLYFAKQSPRWGYKGVAFLSYDREVNPEYYSVVRLWKIKESQFYCIVSQEGGWYNKFLDLGEKEGITVKTFTGCWENELYDPSEDYLSLIKRGLKETTGWTDEKIDNYIGKFLKT
ncbi:MAG: hypothetical protein H5U05_06665 [Candidatus Aminicenantes bacterium]|nr:hypothetical protein [Candidatus Aminicenantes bacterium]